VESIAPRYEVALDGAPGDADRLDVARLDLIQKFAEIERPVGFRVAILDHCPQQDRNTNKDGPENDSFNV
jgi:hypothetical protein